MTRADRDDIVFIDFETTGAVEGFATQPWQIGLVHFSDGKVNETYVFDSLIHIGNRPFNPYAPGRHASLRIELEAAPDMTELWGTLRPWLAGRVLGGHNVSVERAILADVYPLHTFGPWIDTLSLIRIAYPELKSHKLEDIIWDLGLAARIIELCPGRESHDALFDAMASAVLLEFLLQQEGWRDASMEELIHAKPRSYFRSRKSKVRNLRD